MAVQLDRKGGKKAIRTGFGEGLLMAAERDPSVVGLCADVTDSVGMGGLRDRYPERFVQMGVHEQLMVAVAAGMALAGKRPFAASYAVFSPGRSWEAVRTNVCLNDAPVRVVGSHAGVSVGPDGASHQALEDIAIMRSLPNMTVVVPCDATEARKAALALAELDSPSYLRLARPKTEIITGEETPFRIGRAETFRDGRDCAIIACGLMVPVALRAADELSSEGLECRVINCHTIKPIDRETVLSAAETCGRIVTCEEHQVAGGLGSAVAEIVVEANPVPMAMVGVRDRFGQSGRDSELLKEYGLDVEDIKKAVRKICSK
ncbi:transketolase family protein [Candidatus Uhrbacteria bacterium]|nr:transketolase family protein [Candidatus Uhrbacteria bacterium]